MRHLKSDTSNVIRLLVDSSGQFIVEFSMLCNIGNVIDYFTFELFVTIYRDFLFAVSKMTIVDARIYVGTCLSLKI